MDSFIRKYRRKKQVKKINAKKWNVEIKREGKKERKNIMRWQGGKEKEKEMKKKKKIRNTKKWTK